MKPGRLRTKHLRNPAPSPEDGTRIYVGRWYPRGIKDGVLWNERLHDLGPSVGLFSDLRTGEVTHGEFAKRYEAEMAAEPARSLVGSLARRVRHGETITLLCDHPKAIPDEHCHRFLLAALLDPSHEISRLRS